MNETIQQLKNNSTELFPMIRDWASVRGITSTTNPFVQTLKLYEEYGELCGAFLKHKDEKLKDAVGDMIVVLIGLNKIVGNNLEDSIIGYSESDDSLIKDLNTCVGSIAYIINEIMYSKDKHRTANLSNNIISFLDIICLQKDFTIYECVYSAWIEIRNRKGVNINGNFIKYED